MTGTLRQRARRAARRLRFTRQGRWFTGMTFLVGFGAINTGNNLLYLLLGMMLGLILVSGIMSEAMLRRLTAERLSAGPIYAGRQATLEYRLENGKRRLPSFSIEVREVERRDTRDKRRGPRKARRKRGRRERVGRFLGAGGADPIPKADELDPGVPRCFVHRVSPGSAVVRSGRVRLPRRGLYHYDGLSLVTRFPFGFFEKSRRLDRRLELLAFPRVVEPPALEMPARRREGVETRRSAGPGSEFHGLRDYRDGEDWRRIHWKVSSRRPGLVVREDEREHTRTVGVALAHTAIGEGIAEQVAVERAIEVAAAIARERIGSGYAVSLSTQAGTVPLGRGPAQMGRILRALSLLPIDGTAGGPPVRAVPGGVPAVLVSPVGWQGSAPAGVDQRLVVDAQGRVEVGP